MVSKQHCSVCGFLMMYTVQDEIVTYVCPNQSHQRIGKANQGVHVDEKLEDLGPNLDILLQWLKNSGNKKDPS